MEEGPRNIDPNGTVPNNRRQQPVETALYRAILCFASLELGSQDATIRGAAHRWFANPDTGLVSFRMCCEVLGFSRPGAGKRALRWAGLA